MQSEYPSAYGPNHQALSPISFLKRSASIYPDKLAIIYGEQSFTYAEFYRRCLKLASALKKLGVDQGDTVSVLAPNTPMMLETFFGVTMAGGVINPINTRLEAESIQYILTHAEAKCLIADCEYGELIQEATRDLTTPLSMIQYWDEQSHRNTAFADIDYETLIDETDISTDYQLPDSEWQPISLNYTSGTTGKPKGVVYHHRGAYLNGVSNTMMLDLNKDSVYLWTLPLFHCNGWSCIWSVTLAAATHVCLRYVDEQDIYQTITQHDVSHFCAAPVVLTMLANSKAFKQGALKHPVKVATGGAPPTETVLKQSDAIGFKITHLYGLTESFGPAATCEWQAIWDELPLAERCQKLSRQGVKAPLIESIQVMDPDTLQPVPHDGKTLGEVMIQSNTVMLEYFKDKEATEKAFAGGYYHSGDLAVVHPDGYLEIKDRLKDIIISGGENISSIEVENTLCLHPDVLECAVIGKAHAKWGEVPVAFVTLRSDRASIDESELITWCRDRLAHFKCPKQIVFADLPKTATGKIQKNVLREKANKLS